jgi:membrane protease YdiL (CAAX protease family)
MIRPCTAARRTLEAIVVHTETSFDRRPEAPPSGRRRFVGTVAVILAMLAIANVIHKFLPGPTWLVLGPAAAVALVAYARHRGLSWDDLGLSRRGWRRGAGYAAAAVALVAAVYGIAVAIPATRLAFLDSRYQMDIGTALLTALVVIPLGTVLLEEIGFRGVLLGLVRRHRGMRWAAGFSSVLFGFWHVLPSLHLSRANPAIAAFLGAGPAAQVLAIAGAVAFTALAGLVLCELRRRSGSLLASAGLHWAVNALGVLVGLVLRVTGVV